MSWLTRLSYLQFHDRYRLCLELTGLDCEHHEFLSEKKTHSQNIVAFGRIQDKADGFSFEHVSNKHKIREKQSHRQP